MNLIAAPGAYSFFDKKTSIRFETEKRYGQIELFA
jgi:hypothetical protein